MRVELTMRVSRDDMKMVEAINEMRLYKDCGDLYEFYNEVNALLDPYDYDGTAVARSYAFCDGRVYGMTGIEYDCTDDGEVTTKPNVLYTEEWLMEVEAWLTDFIDEVAEFNEDVTLDDELSAVLDTVFYALTRKVSWAHVPQRARIIYEW